MNPKDIEIQAYKLERIRRYLRVVTEPRGFIIERDGTQWRTDIFAGEIRC